MGPIDAEEGGERTIKCPYCHKPSLGVKTGEKYEYLVLIKKRMGMENEKKTNK